MKTVLKIAALMLILTSGTIFLSCDKNDNDSTIPDDTSLLSASDAEGLIFMREEEKLARDSYFKMYELWNAKVFSNISKSEQTHMDLLLDRVEQFKLKDVISQDTGKFVNDDLQKLYDQLVDSGKDSLIAAFIVGATIEEVDIVDLIKYIDITDNEDLKCTYDVLLTGSRNHMRSFEKNMKNAGYTYTPQFLSQTDYDAIINGSHEKPNNCN
ncbi:MAG: DUF2202 domain-containing protein [Bacteroidales bacterium]|nr:DUF2202 domain-containing protein [Bacteroidales bacterium]